MTQPFVVSLKLTGDGRSAVSAVTSTGQAIDQLNAKTEAAKAKAEALNASLGRRGAAEASRSGLQATLEAIQAEQRLEAARLQAQVSDKGRADSINRLAQLGRDAAQVNNALANSEQQLAATYDETSRAARAAALASTDLVTAQRSAALARQASINSALGIGASSSGDRGADIVAYGRELDQIRAKYSPLFAASKAYETELNEINRAHALGAINAQEQASAIARLDAQYTMAAQAANKMAVAGKSAAQSAHTNNLIFQAQDIAMMTAMGQSPMMLALQQGSQVGPILSQMAQVGGMRAALGGVGTALASLVSPINLVTLGVIALGAAGVQAFMSWVSSMGPVERTMEDHREWLDDILKGYGDISKAVNDYLDRAARMPANLLRIDLGEQMTQARAQLDMLRDGIATFGLDYGSLVPLSPFQQFNEDISILKSLRDEYVSGATDAETFASSLRSITSNNNVSPFVRELAQKLYDLVRDAADAEAQLGSLEVGMDRAGQAAQLAAARTQMLNDTFSSLGSGAGLNGGLQNIMDEGVSALDSLRRMVPEIRSTKELAGDLVKTVLDTLPTAAARDEAQALFDTIIQNEAILTARRESARSAGQESAYERQIKAIRERTAAQQLETNVIGLGTYATERARAILELENAAREDAIGLSAERVAQIQQEASAHAMVAAAQEQALEQQRRSAEQLQFYRGTFSGFFADLKSGLKEGQTFWDSLGNAGANALDKIADRALAMAANGLFDMIFGAVMGGLGGGGGWGVAGGFGKPGIFGIPGFASGTDSAPAGLAWVGEQGPELVKFRGGERVYNHTRSMAIAANQNQGSAGINFAPVTNIYGSNMGAAELRLLLDQRDRKLIEQIPGVMAEAGRRAST